MKIEYATVDDVIKILQDVSDGGYGGYIVTCNDEFKLARKDEIPDIRKDRQTIDLGGYFP